jgi:hypothetical protein
MKKLVILTLAWIMVCGLVGYCGGDTVVSGDEDSKYTIITANTTINQSHLGRHNKGFFTNTGAGGAVTVTLMPCVRKTRDPIILTFLTATAKNFVINPSGSEQILTLTNAAGDSITNATVSDFVVLGCFTTGYWHRIGINGTWSDTN